MINPLTPEQLELRKKGIGGSEIAAICGLNKYMGPVDVWRAKCDPTYVVSISAPMERGVYLEDGIANWYAARTGAKLHRTGTLVHPSISLVRCTPDRIAEFPESSVDVSIKSPGPFTQDEWGEPGTDQVPEAYFVQVQWELIILEALYDIRRAHVVAPLDNDLDVYNVLADADTQGHLIEEAQRFWRDHVVTQTPPPVDGFAGSTEWVKSRFPRNTDGMAQATVEANELMGRLQAVRDLKRAAKTEEESITNRLKELCGFHEGIAGDGWHITWRNVRPGYAVDWEAVANELGAPRDIVQKHTRITEGSRRFWPTWETKR